MIECRKIDFRYGPKPFIEGLSCRMKDGRITALIGSNGAGKSTLLRLCARQLTPQAGEILVDGRAGQDVRSFARALAFLPQSRPLPMITVGELAMHGRYAHLSPLRGPARADREAVERALERTGLLELADRRLDSLSGGQRQKAYLAMLMAQEAKHVLLDEPLTHLDVACQLETIDLLRELKNEGRCVVLVLHDLALVPDVCDDVIVMQQGGMIYDGPASELYDTDAVERAFGVRAVRREGVFFERTGG